MKMQRSATVLAAGGMALLSLLGETCLAQEGAQSATNFTGTGWSWSGGGRGGMSLLQIMDAGGSLMWVIAFISIVAIAMIAYFFYVLRPGLVAPTMLLRDLVEKIEDGDMDGARRLCEQKSSPISAVVLAAIEYVRGSRNVEESLLKDIIEGEGSRQAEDIQGQTQYLLDVGVIAPMVGLLGTVFGMLHAFSGIAHDIASAKPVVLAEGVAMALLTTAFGLIVGIPAMAFYSYFRRRASKLVSYLEMASTDVMTAMVNRTAHGLDSGIKVKPPEKRV
jgi:biopolymer transport protein ExbB